MLAKCGLAGFAYLWEHYVELSSLRHVDFLNMFSFSVKLVLVKNLVSTNTRNSEESKSEVRAGIWILRDESQGSEPMGNITTLICLFVNIGNYEIDLSGFSFLSPVTFYIHPEKWLSRIKWVKVNVLCMYMIFSINLSYYLNKLQRLHHYEYFSLKTCK